MKSEISIEELRKFCQSFRLTPRETEVVEILAEGVVRIKDVAERLKLSPNTVNNHVNSIFLKTKTRAKSELLAMLLHQISEDLHWFRLLAKKPRVLFALNEPNEIATVAEYLARRHLQVTALPTSKYEAETQDVFDTYQPHFLLLEVDSLDDCAEQVKKARSRGVKEVFLISANPSAEERACSLAAAAEIMVKPLDPEYILRCILSHYVEEDSERVRLNDPRNDSKFGGEAVTQLNARSQIQVPLKRWGRGGVFLTSEDLRAAFSESVKAGDRVEFSAALSDLDGSPSAPIKAVGQVSWVRSESANGRTAGAGVRLFAIEAHQELRRKLSHMTEGSPYIPAGLDS